jgi:hypothetical protein
LISIVAAQPSQADTIHRHSTSKGVSSEAILSSFLTQRDKPALRGKKIFSLSGRGLAQLPLMNFSQVFRLNDGIHCTPRRSD